MYRQGDVLIMALEESAVPANLLEAPGELRDGRGRSWSSRSVRSPDMRTRCRGRVRLIREGGVFGPMLLHLPDGGRVVHEEHAVISLPKGWFRVVRQREYAPGAVRIVAD